MTTTLVTALQYWKGDEEQALMLARLLADIEKVPTDEMLLVLSRRGDCELSPEARQTQLYCSQKFATMCIQSPRGETGHPDGCFGLWAGTAMKLYELWQRGAIPWFAGRTVFLAEADGGPLQPGWRRRIVESHDMTLKGNKRVTGAIMERPFLHVNGNFVMDLSLIADYPALMKCPSKVAWDLHHAPILVREARSSYVIRNEYETRDWTPGALRPLGREAAWLHGCKDDSLFNFIRLMLRTLWRT